METEIRILGDEDMRVGSTSTDEFLKLKNIILKNSKNNKEKQTQ